jgi:hypothetical protein
LVGSSYHHGMTRDGPCQPRRPTTPSGVQPLAPARSPTRRRARFRRSRGRVRVWRRAHAADRPAARYFLATLGARRPNLRFASDRSRFRVLWRSGEKTESRWTSEDERGMFSYCSITSCDRGNHEVVAMAAVRGRAFSGASSSLAQLIGVRYAVRQPRRRDPIHDAEERQRCDPGTLHAGVSYGSVYAG